MVRIENTNNFEIPPGGLHKIHCSVFEAELSAGKK